ncbi:MAG: hypothetical protein J6O73_02195 [Lachnospiraceae bacterium]|nr:hypothetical protein [Lachnospiraceae bacterium]
MTTMEILLLVGGLAAFVISFFLPDGTTAEAGEGISQEELQQLFDDEVELSRQKIDDMTKETLDYSMEKTERSLEKIANEKIMAVGEYSDTVLDQINQSHNQVVFLSDMLRKSKDELTELLNRADRTSKDANERANEAYDLAGNAMKLAEDAAERAEEAGRTAVSAEEKMIDARRLMHEGIERTAANDPEDALDQADEVELPAEIFEGLVNEFSLEEETEENAAEDGYVAKRGAEERLAENLSAFRDSLKENEEDDTTGADETVVGQEVRDLPETDEVEKRPESADREDGVSEGSGDFGEEGFRTLDDLFAKHMEPVTESGDLPDIAGQEEFEMEAPAGSREEEYAGMTEEEKMEALLRAATQELAQDVSAVTGISEMHWEPAEEEETGDSVDGPVEEETYPEAEAELTESTDTESADTADAEEKQAAEREAKARALDALKEEAESEYREIKVKAIENLKAEAEMAALTTAEEEPAPAEDAEFLQSLLKGDEPAELGADERDEAELENGDTGMAETLNDEEREADKPVADAVPEKKTANTKKTAESEDEYADQLTIEAVMKEFDQMTADAEKGEGEQKEEPAKKTASRKTTAKKSARASGNGSRRRSSKKSEQTGNGTDGVSLQFAPGAETGKNNNDRILEMHRMGRSDMAIAKDLGMGIGEVKLIIALNEIS